MRSSTRRCVTTVTRPNHAPRVPMFLRSRTSRSRVRPETTSVSPSATRAIMSDSSGGGPLTIGLRLSVTTASDEICGVTLKVTRSVRTMDGSLFSVSSCGFANDLCRRHHGIRDRAVERQDDVPAMRAPMKIRHLMLLILCMMYFIAYVDRVNISVAGPAMRKELGLTATQLGLIFSAFAYPYAGMQIVGGWLSDRLGPRVVLAVLSVMWAGATIMTGLSWSIGSLVAFRVLVGLGEVGAFPTATRAFTFWMPARERGFAQGVTHSFARLGGAVTPAIVLAIVAAYGWRESLIVLGSLSLLWT